MYQFKFKKLKSENEISCKERNFSFLRFHLLLLFPTCYRIFSISTGYYTFPVYRIYTTEILYKSERSSRRNQNCPARKGIMLYTDEAFHRGKWNKRRDRAFSFFSLFFPLLSFSLSLSLSLSRSLSVVRLPRRILHSSLSGEENSEAR